MNNRNINIDSFKHLIQQSGKFGDDPKVNILDETDEYLLLEIDGYDFYMMISLNEYPLGVEYTAGYYTHYYDPPEVIEHDLDTWYSMADAFNEMIQYMDKMDVVYDNLQ